MAQNPQESKIVDFDTVLDSLLVDENHVWGKKNKPRNEEPNMFEIMAWEEKGPNLHDFKSNNRALLKSSEIVKYKQQINRGGNLWKTENQDAFRKFIYSPTKKSAMFQEMDPELKDRLIVSHVRPVSAESGRQKEFQGIVTKDGEIIPEEIYFEQLDKKYTSDYLDKYSLKRIKDEDDLRRELFENAQKYQEQQYDKKNNLSKSDSKISKKLVPKSVQVKPYIYDKKGNLIGVPEDYFKDIWCEVDDSNQKNQNKGKGSPLNKAKTLEGDYHEHLKEIEDSEHSEEEHLEIKKTDYSGVKSKLLSTKTIKKARVLDPHEDKDKLERRKARIKKFTEQTKWMANSTFTTYFGKPAFENYGRGNLKPAIGGIIYGNYLKTHNVNPHRGNKNPQFKQTFNNALMYGSRMPVCEPELPRKVKEDYRLSQQQVESLKNRNKLFPDENKQEIFENQKIIKPDLINSLRFASEENTPVNSPTFRGMGKSSLVTLQKEQKAIRKKLASKSAKKDKNSKQTKISKSLEKKLATTSTVQNTKESKENLLIGKGSGAEKKEKDSNIKMSKKQQQQHHLVETTNLNLDSKQQGSKKQQQFIQTSYIPVDSKHHQPNNQLNMVDTVNIHPESRPQTSSFRPEKQTETIEQKQKSMKLSKKQREKAKQEELINEIDDKVYPEHEAKVQRKFMKSLREKKEVSNRLAPKVTEVYPVQVKSTTRQTKQKTKDREVPPQEIAVDEMNPPCGYISNFTSNELNPKFYKHIPANWMKRIPYAGKFVEKSEAIKECIQPEEA